jgi:L-fucose isomerase-like protein
VLFEGKPVVHFNEVDEGAGLDALLTNRIWTDMGLDPATTLHDVRWGEAVKDWGVDDFVWVFEISGAIPPNHFERGYRDALGQRQPPMYFRRGGSTVKGASRPGEIVWSRIYVEGDALHMDIGRGGVVKLPAEEMERRWQATTPVWPIMSAVTYGVSRDQFMAKHKANHVQVVYAPDAATARRALVRKASMARELGLSVNLCGDLEDELKNHQKA